MAGTEELLARLQQLEDGYYGDKEAARQKNFLDTYGARFSNNRGIGLAILNELDARGIDTSAADEAVQEILNTLRVECNEIIEAIKDVQQDAIENAQKVEAIKEAVSDAVAQNPATSIGGEPPVIESGEMPPEASAEVAQEGAMPAGMDTENPGEPAQEPSAEEPAPEGAPEGAPEEDQGPAPEPPAEEEPAPEEPEKVTSDARMKTIHGVIANGRSRRRNLGAIKTNNSFKPSAGMLEAASRGY